MYSQIIHIDGPDKTGKDTVRDIVVKQAKGNYLVYVRSFISQIIYSRLYNRKIDEKFFWERLKNEYLQGAKFFVFICMVEEVEHRFKAHDEKDIHISEFEKHQEAFLNFVQEAADKGVKIHVIDTSFATPQESARELENHVQNDFVSNCVNCNLCKVKESEKSTNYCIGGKDILVVNTVNLKVNKDSFDFLQKCLLESGILERCVVTDSVRCSTKSGKIEYQDFSNCSFHLQHQIEMLQPKVILALGNQVYEFLIASKLFPTHKIVKINSPAVIKFGKVTEAQYLKQLKNSIKV